MERNTTAENEIAMRQGDFLPRIGAGCLVMIGFVIGVIGLTSFLESHTLGWLGLTFYGLIGIGFLVSGVFWLRYITTLESARRNMFAEKAVLEAAARHGGSATVVQIALEAPLTVGETEDAIARLCRQGAARAELTDDGAVIYRFAGLIDG